jgi:3',5'-cyclic AMP phosphodiesterase CpdA
MTSNNETQRRTFTWLHLTDLHVGMKDQDWMWPRLKERFYQDLSRLHKTSGNWDLVVFSGDLTQRGSREDFDRLDAILADLWRFFEKLGCSPKLIVLPGNHDVGWRRLTMILLRGH